MHQHIPEPISSQISPDMPDYILRARRQELIAAGHPASLVDAALRQVATPAARSQAQMAGFLLMLATLSAAAFFSWQRVLDAAPPMPGLVGLGLAFGLALLPLALAELVVGAVLHWLAAPRLARLGRPLIYGAVFSSAAVLPLALVVALASVVAP